MIYIRVNGVLYPAAIDGKVLDTEWDKRESKSITIEMEYVVAVATFVSGVSWSVVQQDELPVYDEDGNQTATTVRETEWDNSEYCLAGDITDHRDGTVTVKMGKLTELEEAYEMMLGGM